MPDGLRLALTTFTVLPVRGPHALDRRTAGVAMALGPLVGLGVGLVAAAVVLGLGELSPGAELPAAGALVALALLSRGLHLDGLMDTADGLASYAPPERARQIMKEPGVGALGVATFGLVLLVQYAALLTCTAAGRGPYAIGLAVVVGRLAVVAACTPGVPAATPTGLGALVAGTVRRGTFAVVAGLVVGAAAAAAAPDGAAAALRATLAVALGLLVASALRRHAVRRLGGVTGDVLGALIEVSTAVVLVVLSVSP